MSASVSTIPHSAASMKAGHAPPKSHATPAISGATVVPIRVKKLNRPRYSASPSASWAMSVCDPDQANDSAPPLMICTKRSGQNHGISGNTGASVIAIPMQTSVTRRVPYRSINTPRWIDRNTARNDRAPTSSPICPALIPSDRP